MTFFFSRERQGVSLKRAPEVKNIQNSFHKEVFKNVCSITNWDVVEKPFKRVDTKRYSMLS